jgi:hypothetical protein
MVAFKAFCKLIAALFNLVTALVDLVAAGIGRLARAIRESNRSTNPRRIVPTVIERPVPLPQDTTVQLAFALQGLGFRPPAVKKYVAAQTAGYLQQPLEILIKDGVRALAS